MSFVLVLAAAVTLVVGLLQSGLTLIYLSIACSVLAGVVLAVAVLRGRPEPRPAAAGGRSFSPPQRAQVPAAVGASSTETTSSWSSPPVVTSPQPTPPPPPPTPAPAPAGEDLATRAAGSALLGRLRGRRAEQQAGTGEATAVTAPPADSEPAAVDAPEPAATPTAVISAPAGPTEGADGFPIEDYDRLRATELLAMLPSLDRNQLEAVRQRESSGKNRFTIMSRVDSLLASREEPAWEAGDDDWDDGVGTDAESEAVAIESAALRGEPGFGAELDEEEDHELDELVSPAPSAASAGFPIAGYETLTVGQILPRLSELDADELAQVRAREQQGRNRGTVLDRIDRLSARAGTSGAMAMPAAPPARTSTARKSTGSKAPASKSTASKSTASKAPAAAAKKSPAPRAAKTATAPLPMPAAPTTPVKAARKTPAKKTAVAPVLPATKAVRKSPARKAAAAPSPAPAPVTPAPAKATMKDAVKKARATKKR